MSWLQALLGAMETHGLAPPDGVAADGELHRFRVDGDKPGSKSGWYRVFPDDHPTAVFGTWRTGERHVWHSDSTAASDRRVCPQRVAAAKKRRQDDESQRHSEAATRARKIWDAASDPDPRHQYLRGKGIQARTATRSWFHCETSPARYGRCNSLPRTAPSVFCEVAALRGCSASLVSGRRVCGCARATLPAHRYTKIAANVWSRRSTAETCYRSPRSCKKPGARRLSR